MVMALGLLLFSSTPAGKPAPDRKVCPNKLMKLKHVFHVRLVGSIEKRVEHVSLNLGISRKAALELIRKQDRGRQRYLKRYFDKDVHDPLLYHLIINTDLVTYENTALMIGEAALTRLYSLTVRANKGG